MRAHRLTKKQNFCVIGTFYFVHTPYERHKETFSRWEEYMNAESKYLQQVGKKLAPLFLKNPKVTACILTGSSAKGISDVYSDIDIIIYRQELPTDAELHIPHKELGPPMWVLDRREDGLFYTESYMVDGIECQFGNVRIASWEKDLDKVLVHHEVDLDIQKAFSGVVQGIPLCGEELIQQWKQRILQYPEELATGMVVSHLNIFSLWSYPEYLKGRDATLWIYESLVENCKKILAILAGLNREYFSGFQFKRMQHFTSKLKIAPPELNDRIENLFRVSLEDAFLELEKLVSEVLDLVSTHMPDIDTSKLKNKIGMRRKAWQIKDRES